MRVDSFLTNKLKEKYRQQYEAHYSENCLSDCDFSDRSWLQFFLSKTIADSDKEYMLAFFKKWIEASNTCENDRLSFYIMNRPPFSNFIQTELPFIHMYCKLFHASRHAQSHSDDISESFILGTIVNAMVLIFFVGAYCSSPVLLPELALVALIESAIILNAVFDYFKDVVAPWYEQKKEIIQSGKLNKTEEAEEGAPGYWFAFWSHPFIKLESSHKSQSEPLQEHHKLL